MKPINSNSHIKNEIRQRMNDSSWDELMAKSINAEQGRRTGKTRRMAAGLSSLATAAAIIAALTMEPFSGRSDKTMTYQEIIAAQVNGTYTAATGSEHDSRELGQIIIFSEDTDTFIEESMIARYGVVQ